ncbi:stage II sporulation protein D [Paenibacillus sp. DS2015]|uniref:stage II sporulation protein D n=1 Tax=Paenibacillus sp. DS2015 TaxID=3373917 RepID=UPI003D1ECC6A
MKDPYKQINVIIEPMGTFEESNNLREGFPRAYVRQHLLLVPRKDIGESTALPFPCTGEIGTDEASQPSTPRTRRAKLGTTKSTPPITPRTAKLGTTKSASLPITPRTAELFLLSREHATVGELPQLRRVRAAKRPAPGARLRASRQVARLRLRRWGAAAKRQRPNSSAKWRLHPAVLAAGALLALALLLPVLVVMIPHQPNPPAPEIAAPGVQHPSAPVEAEEPNVSVYLTKTGQIETLPLEEYVTGVIAAEMPADFEFEALKAQAIAARTFIVRRLMSNDKSGVPATGEGAIVTDTVNHQAYISKDTLETEWKQKGKEAQLEKLIRATQASRNTVMTYQGKPITASFFSTSNGYTENSEEYWTEAIPYLRSVSSPWDSKIAPHYKDTVTISQKEFSNKLGLSNSAISALAMGKSSKDSLIHIISTTTGHRIKELNIDGITFSGREVREKLGLRSSQFTWTLSGNDIEITTYGYGHGVGMSQWGANGMAQEGYTATQILKHYYTSIQFQQVTNLLPAKKIN